MRVVPLLVTCLLAACVGRPLAATEPSLYVAPKVTEATSLPALRLPFTPRARAARAAGGFYALGDAGQLARVDLHGRLTGVFQTELTSLATTRDYLCGVDASRRVLCARDPHRDATCASAPLLPFAQVALPGAALATLESRQAGRALCVVRDSRALACISGESSCGRICLAFPACAPPRCIDPCPPGRTL